MLRIFLIPFCNEILFSAQVADKRNFRVKKKNHPSLDKAFSGDLPGNKWNGGVQARKVGLGGKPGAGGFARCGEEIAMFEFNVFDSFH